MHKIYFEYRGVAINPILENRKNLVFPSIEEAKPKDTLQNFDGFATVHMPEHNLPARTQIIKPILKPLYNNRSACDARRSAEAMGTLAEIQISLPPKALSSENGMKLYAVIQTSEDQPTILAIQEIETAFTAIRIDKLKAKEKIRKQKEVRVTLRQARDVDEASDPSTTVSRSGPIALSATVPCR